MFDLIYVFLDEITLDPGRPRAPLFPLRPIRPGVPDVPLAPCFPGGQYSFEAAQKS